jgi:UDP-glucuronate decarboxylase
LRPGDGRVVPNFIAQISAGQALTIYGDGSQTRSFCYVDDLVEGIVRLAHSQSAIGRAVNLGNANEITVCDLAQVVAEVAGVSLAVVRAPLPPDDPSRRCPDVSLAKELLDWTARVSLHAGLRRTLDAGRATGVFA